MDSAFALDRDAKPGDTVTFGAYPQAAEGADRTPIQWRVLDNSGGEVFLLSAHLLDCKRYHGESVDITWRDCDLRRWLNETFYEAAFTDAEKGVITTVRCTDNGAGSSDTDDRVFLPSAAEVEAATGVLGKDFRRAAGTEYARVKKADGCRLYVYDKSVAEDYITVDGRTQGCSWWWLRTRGNRPDRATFMGMRASMRHYGQVHLPYYGVRPALKLHVGAPDGNR